MKTHRDPANPAYTGSMADSHHEGPDPREFFRLLWRRKVLILLCLTLIPLAAYAYSERLTKTYQAKTTISVQGTATDAGLFLGLQFKLEGKRGKGRQFVILKRNFLHRGAAAALQPCQSADQGQQSRQP